MAATEPNPLTLVCQLRSRDPAVSAAAEAALGTLFHECGTTAMLTSLAGLLANTDWCVRDGALQALTMLTKVKDSRVMLNVLAGSTIGKLTLDDVLLLAGVEVTWPEGRRDQRQILQLLRHEDAWVRARAAQSVGDMGVQVGTWRIIAALSRLLRDEDGRVRRAAALALAAIGRPAARRRVLAGIVRLFGDPDHAMQYDAAVAIARFGRLAVAYPVLCGLAALHDPGWGGDQWYASRLAIRSMGSAAAVPKFLRWLARTLPGEDRQTQAYHLGLLAEIGPPAAKKAVLASVADILRRGRAAGDLPGGLFDAIAAMGAAAGKHEPLVIELKLMAESDLKYLAADARAVLRQSGLSSAEEPDSQASTESS
jgi:hypothetical protein